MKIVKQWKQWNNLCKQYDHAIICIAYFFSTAFSSLHDKSIETDGKRSSRIEESIAL